MRFRLSDSDSLKQFEKQINDVGFSVNDPALFERIQKACLNQQAFLFIAPDCFAVLKPMSDQVVIWAGCSSSKTNHNDIAADLDRLAADVSAKRLIFFSNRTGFFRIAPRFGFSPFPDEWMGKPITRWVKYYE